MTLYEQSSRFYLITLIKGSRSRANSRMRICFAPDLVGQKISKADGALKAAKAILASLILQYRTESREG